jgi:hypothetical protein
MTGGSGCTHAPDHSSVASTNGQPELSRPVIVRYVFESSFGAPDRVCMSWHGAAVAAHNVGTDDGARARVTESIDLARFEAIRGRQDSCREHLRRAVAIAPPSSRAHIGLARSSILGLLELGLGNVGAAAAHFGRCAHPTTACPPNPWLSTFEADNAEALLALGRQLEARAAVARQGEHARRSVAPRSLAAAARCRALLAGLPEFEQRFEAALALHDLLPGAFDRARTQLCYGERLRRARRRIDSREQLEPALATFDSLDATPWVRPDCPRPSDRSGDARRVDSRQRSDRARGRGAAFPQRQDGRGAPRPRLSEARRPQPSAARGRAFASRLSVGAIGLQAIPGGW